MILSRLRGIFAVALLFALAALFPLRLALDWADAQAAGLAARDVTGSIWFGELEGARLGALALGDAAVSVSPLGLIAGSPRLRLDLAEPIEGSLGLVLGGGLRGLNDASATLPLGALGLSLPLAGEVALRDVTALFEDGRCARTEGEVGVLPRITAPGLAWEGPPLEGAPVCEGGALLLPLSGSNAAGSLAIRLQLAGSGAYRGEITVNSADAGLAGALQLAGFTIGPTGLRQTVEGQLGTTR